MLASTTSANLRAPQPKHKAACDQCNASKVKCPGGGPQCKRCADSSQPCHYSLARRFGKPLGSKNRKTLERLRQTKERDSEDNNIGGGGGDISIPGHYGSKNDNHKALDGEGERREGDDSHNTMSSRTTSDFWPLSPLIDYSTFSDASQFIPSPEHDVLDGHQNVLLDDDDGSVLRSADPKFPNTEGLRRAESRSTWADNPDESWNSSSPSIDPRLSSGPAHTDSPFSEYSHSSTIETYKLISLDTVAARLEENAGYTVTHLQQQQPTLCRCLRQYADVLCKLQTIERRQRPVQLDTLLTCANLILNTAENQLTCTQCQYDFCVAMQLIMIFQTIFTWSKDLSHHSKTPGPDLRMTLGQHEMTEDERSFIKTALMCKILDRIATQLKLMMSRIEHVALKRQGKQPYGHEGGEYSNLQPLVRSLIQNFGSLFKDLRWDDGGAHTPQRVDSQGGMCQRHAVTQVLTKR